MWAGWRSPGCWPNGDSTTPSQVGDIKNLNSNKIKSKLAQECQAAKQQKVAGTVVWQWY